MECKIMRSMPNNKTKEKKHNELVKKYGRSKFKDSKEFIENAGAWEGENVSLDKIRELTYNYASEKVLAKDWLTPEEDEAWKDL
jgi:hypothetical protein